MKRVAFDLESNGLLWDATVIHCLVLKDIDTQETRAYPPHKVIEGLKVLQSADEVIGHNVVAFDLPLVAKLHPWFNAEAFRVVDTLILSRLLFPNLSDLDRERGYLAGTLIGSHSLKAWGQRLSFEKDEYEGGWENFSQEMLDYNVRDVEVTERLHQVLIENPALSQQAVEIEHEIAHIAAAQERFGFTFDKKAAEELNARLLVRKHELEQELQDTFQPFYLPDGFMEPKVNNKCRGVTKGDAYNKIKLTTFNPGSRHHIAHRLKALYNWEPTQFTPGGEPQVDEVVLSELEYPEAKLLSEYFLVQKRLGMLSEGKNSYLKLERDGVLHGEVLTGGTVTGRCSHRNPNLGQVPAVGVPWGKEFRSLFKPSPGNVLVGCDMSGLELRCLAHFMNDPEYTKVLLEGDIHAANQEKAGLETRKQAKTFIYGFLYGAGAAKLGSIIGKGAREGQKLKTRFLDALPSLKRLMNQVSTACKRGYLIGMDGRRLHIRSEHSALNTLLQSAGAISSKVWVIKFNRALKERGWTDKVHQVAYVHDELQIDCPPDLAQEVGELCVRCIEDAGKDLGFRVPLSGEFKIGRNWAETH